MSKLQNRFEAELQHAKSMEKHYRKQDTEDGRSRWHYWYGRQQVCEEILAEIKNEASDQKAETSPE